MHSLHCNIDQYQTVRHAHLLQYHAVDNIIMSKNSIQGPTPGTASLIVCIVELMKLGEASSIDHERKYTAQIIIQKEKQF